MKLCSTEESTPEVWRFLLQYFQAKDVECKIISLPTQEANKDFELVYEIARQLEAFGINRSAVTNTSFRDRLLG